MRLDVAAHKEPGEGGREPFRPGPSCDTLRGTPHRHARRRFPWLGAPPPRPSPHFVPRHGPAPDPRPDAAPRGRHQRQRMVETRDAAAVVVNARRPGRMVRADLRRARPSLRARRDRRAGPRQRARLHGGRQRRARVARRRRIPAVVHRHAGAGPAAAAGVRVLPHQRRPRREREPHPRGGLAARARAAPGRGPPGARGRTWPCSSATRCTRTRPAARCRTSSPPAATCASRPERS